MYNNILVCFAGSGERGESDPESECAPQAPASEDEFAEDELSLGEQGGENLPPGTVHSGTSSLQGSTGNDLCRDIDSSDADDRSRFLGARNLSLPPGQRSRGSRAHRGQTQRPRSLDRRRGSNWRNKGPECGEFHEGLLLDALLQLYPNVVGVQGSTNQPLPHEPHRLPYILPVPGPPPHPQNHVNPYDSVPVLGQLHQHHPLTTFRPMKPMSHDSDSGYSNNTSGGRGSSRGRKDNHRLSAHSSDLVLS